MRAVVVIALVGCAYKADSFSYVGPNHDFPGERATVGCLDIAVTRRPDMDRAAIIGFQFGNRCDAPSTVDLAFAQVIGRTETGEEIKLAPYDPKGQMKALRLDGRSYGSEAIAYPYDNPIAQVCIDVHSVAHVAGSKWLCLSAEAPPPPRTPGASAPLIDGEPAQASDAEEPPAKPEPEPAVDEPRERQLWD